VSEKAEKKGSFFGNLLGLFGVGVIVAIGINVFGGGASGGSGTAINCLTTQDQYGNRRFGNSCSFPVVIRVCTKQKVSALSEGLLGSRPNWKCQQALTQPRRVGVSIGWNSGLMSGANYVAGVCRSGYRVNVDVESGRFTCTK